MHVAKRKETKVDVNLNIEDKDIHYLKEYLKDKANPVDLEELAYRLALFKTRETRSHRVIVYNPNCEYKIGDLIYKEYPGKIPIGSKKYIEIDRGVVLKVVDVRTRFGIDEVQMRYEGTSEFKKYTDYLDRQKIELLLPHRQAKPCEKIDFLPEDNDPRKQQAPLEKRDFAALTKKLAGAINKESDIAIVSRKVLLKEHLKPLDEIVFTKIKEFLQENKKSEPTEFFVENFAKIKVEDEQFDAYCFALNYRMTKDFKIDFQQTQDVGWGKWNLISVIYYMKRDSLISEVNPLVNSVIIANKRNLMQRRRKFEDNLFQDSCMRFYLTQREITAGAVKLKPGFFDLGESIEVEVVDGRQKKSYLVYYYKDVNLMLGFKEIFERYKALQGTMLTFELTEDEKLQFNIRTTKKGTIVDRVEYVKEEKFFKVTDEKVASPVFVNKSMFLDSFVFKTLYEKLKEFRNIDTLNKLIHKVFLEFGVKERNYEIHILRLYHILDLVYPVDFKLVEDVILGNDEFVPAEKIAGVFYLDSEAVAEIEEEELKRKEFEADEHKKRREELKRKKMERERRIKDEIRRKREERRKKREQEMWEKERLKKEMEEKRVLELRKKREEETRRKEEENRKRAAFRGERPYRPKEMRKPPGKKFEPAPPKDRRRQEGPHVPYKPPRPPRPIPEFIKPQPPPPDDELVRKREVPPRRDKEKRKIEEERERAEKAVKAARKVERRPEDDAMSEDEIKSQIELEKLKEKMKERREAEKEAEKDKKIAYHDNGGFGGIFASQLDKIVKKEDEKPNKEEDKEKKKQ
jgi:hypothetical protein